MADSARVEGGVEEQIPGVFLMLDGRECVQRLGVNTGAGHGRPGVGVFFGEFLRGEGGSQGEGVVQAPFGANAALVGFVVRERPALAVQFVVIQH